jgi:hypothetical protein
MAYGKVIVKTKISNAVRRKAKRLSACLKVPVIVFKNQDDNPGECHFRTLPTMTSPEGDVTCALYWNFIPQWGMKDFQAYRHYKGWRARRYDW